jgi:antitoxin (DNA-binding transcriptional repressor) of toxin-antitoxin stability system
MKPVRYGSRGAGRRSVSATEAARNFGRLVDHVREARVEYVVERGGVGVARIAPVASQAFLGRDLVTLMHSVAEVDGALAREVDAGRSRTNRPAVPRDPWAS